MRKLHKKARTCSQMQRGRGKGGGKERQEWEEENSRCIRKCEVEMNEQRGPSWEEEACDCVCMHMHVYTHICVFIGVECNLCKTLR